MTKIWGGEVAECSLSEELGDTAQIVLLVPVCCMIWDP